MKNMAWDTGLEKDSAAYALASDKSKCIRAVAGPGTGKSFGLQRRVAKMLEDGVPPEKIFAVTFTRLAASDMKKEILATGIEGADRIFVKTLHSYCYGILNRPDVYEVTKRYPRPMIEYEQTPMIYDLNNKTFGNFEEKKKRLGYYESCLAQDPGACSSNCSENTENKEFESALNEWLKEHNAMLLDEIIDVTYNYLLNRPDSPERRRFEYVLVDEYQDLNEKEQALIDLIAFKNIVIIGDDNQSIYSFKHASPRGIRNFRKNHPECKDITFDYCRRCPKKVVAIASNLISHNAHRSMKSMNSFENNPEGDVRIIQWKTLTDEVSGLTEIIQTELAAGKIKPEDILVLSPNEQVGTLLREALNDAGIEAKSYFREDSVIDEAFRYNFALLNCISNPEDYVSLRYLIGVNSPNWYVKSYARIRKYASEKGLTVKEVLERNADGRANIQYTKTITNLYKNISAEMSRIRRELQRSREQITELLPIGDILTESVSEIGYMEEVDLTVWMTKLSQRIIGKISFRGNIGNEKKVRIMSLHASKGLSAKCVIIAGCSDQFISEKVQNVKEARRLFYVAVTRCKGTEDYPGKLVISAFENLRAGDVSRLKFSSKYRFCEFFLTKHIYELGTAAPLTTRPYKNKRSDKNDSIY